MKPNRVEPRTNAPGSRRHVLLAGLLLVIIAVGAGAVFFILRQQSHAALVLSGVPATPDLSRWPEVFKERIRICSTAAPRAANPIAPLGELAALYHANGFVPQAKQVLFVLRRLDPASAKWAYLLADLHLRGNDSAAAEHELVETTRLDPSYATAWLRLGYLQIQRNAFEEARRSYTSAVAAAPGDVRTEYVLLAFKARHDSDRDLRVRVESLVHANPGIRELHQLLSAVALAAGDTAVASREKRLADNARRILDDTDPWLDQLGQSCYDPNRLSLLATAATQQRRFSEAEALLKKAVQLAPKDPLLREGLYAVYELMGRHDDARAELERGVRECPDDVNLQVQLSRVLSQEQRTAVAISMLQSALVRWPSDARLHAALGFSLGQAGRNEEAIAALREAIRIDPTDIEVQYNLAACYFADGQLSAATEVAEQLLGVRPNYAEALVLLAGIAVNSGDIAGAERYVLRVREVHPDHASLPSLTAAVERLRGSGN